jgi:L-lactate oxidase
MSLNLSRRDLLVTGGAVTTMAAVPGAIPTQAASRTSGATETDGLPDNEKRINIVTLRDLEAEARKVMLPFGYAYVSGGAGDEMDDAGEPRRI